MFYLLPTDFSLLFSWGLHRSQGLQFSRNITLILLHSDSSPHRVQSDSCWFRPRQAPHTLRVMLTPIISACIKLFWDIITLACTIFCTQISWSLGRPTCQLRRYAGSSLAAPILSHYNNAILTSSLCRLRTHPADSSKDSSSPCHRFNDSGRITNVLGMKQLSHFCD